MKPPKADILKRLTSGDIQACTVISICTPVNLAEEELTTARA